MQIGWEWDGESVGGSREGEIRLRSWDGEKGWWKVQGNEDGSTSSNKKFAKVRVELVD